MINNDPSSKIPSTLKLDNIKNNLQNKSFDKIKHDSESRIIITKLFLKWYFGLICGSFIFSFLYNFTVAYVNLKLISKNLELLSYLNVSNTVSIITTTLSSGVGFVIGYYFKNKGE